MTDAGKPGVPVVVNGHQYTLRQTFSSLMRAERVTGVSMMMLTPQNFGFTVIAAFFWAGLGDQIPGLTLEGAAEMLQKHVDGGGKLSPIIDAINEALDQSGLLQATQGNAPGPDATGSGNNAD